MKASLILNIIIALFIYEWVIKILATVFINKFFSNDDKKEIIKEKKTFEQRIEEMAKKKHEHPSLFSKPPR